MYPVLPPDFPVFSSFFVIVYSLYDSPSVNVYFVSFLCVKPFCGYHRVVPLVTLSAV